MEIISLKDRLETVKNKKTAQNIKDICLSLANDAESYKRIVIICETIDGSFCSSWIGMNTGNTVLEMIEAFLRKFAEIVNSSSKQTCPKCESKMYYLAPKLLGSSWSCASPKCEKRQLT
jgi:hypothetical protein